MGLWRIQLDFISYFALQQLNAKPRERERAWKKKKSSASKFIMFV